MNDEYRNAIGGVESSNNYSAVGPETDSGDRAYGRYQVMGNNIPAWTKLHTGTEMTPDQFLKSPEAQDAVFNGETSAAYKKFGNLNDVTSTWFSGRPMAKAGNASDGYNTVPQYVSKVNARLNPTAMQAAMSPSTRNAMAAAPDDTPALTAANAGALSGNNKNAWMDNLGSTLMNMAPGLASIGDPARAAALAQIAAAQNKNQGSWSTNYDPRTGIATQTNSAGGATRQFKYAEPKPDDKWVLLGKDKNGNDIHGYQPTPEEYAASQAKKDTTDEGPADPALTGKDFMDDLEKRNGSGYREKVQAILDGRADFPTGRAAAMGPGKQLSEDVLQADHTFEAGNSGARKKVRNEFMAGGVSSPAGQITAGNTALQHAGEMSDALEQFKGPNGEMDHSSIPFLSYWQNRLHNGSVAGTAAGAPLNDFNTARDHFAEEVTKFYAGTAGSEGERQRALDNLDAAKSLPELRSAIAKETSLMQGKVNALQDRWRTGMGPMVADFPLIKPEAQKAIDRVQQRKAASAVPTSAPAAATATSATRKTSNGIPWSIN